MLRTFLSCKLQDYNLEDYNLEVNKLIAYELEIYRWKENKLMAYEKEKNRLVENELEVYKIETLGALDGPGLRTVIFLQGCPMRCQYCHNADSWLANAGKGTMMRAQSLYDLVLRYKPYYKDKGGVTFSGGEALLQAKGLLPLVKALKNVGIHTALDTSGSIINEDTQNLIDAIDLVILDIKATDEALHQTLTKHSLKNPLATLATLKAKNKPYWIRQVVLKGINDTDAHLSQLDELTAHPTRERLERLPYHSMGLDKWEGWQIEFRREF